MTSTYAYLVATAAGDGTSSERLLDLERQARELVVNHGSSSPSLCPQCGGDDWVRDGYAARKRGRVQIFRCRPCGKKRVGHGDSPFRHPSFPPEVMVLAVLLKRMGWTATRIASALVVTTPAGELERPNRQTVGRWVKKLGPFLDSLTSESVATDKGNETSEGEPPHASVRVSASTEDAERQASTGRPMPQSPPAYPVHEPEVAELPSFIAGRFEVLGTLGEPSGEAVGLYKVRDRWNPGSDDAPLALKLLPAEDAPLVGREFGLRSRLHHPNVAIVYDCGFLDDGRHWFTQELIDGVDLYVAARGATFQTILEWLVGVLRGCAFLHGRGIVHRDLKPDNILVDKRGVPRIVDFGISVHRSSSTDNSSSGSLAYTPPEAFADSGPTPLFDLYAVGRTFLHVLLRKLPGAGADAAGDSLERVRPEVPAWFEQVLNRLSAPRASERYPHALAVIDDIVDLSGLHFDYETEGTRSGRVHSSRLIERHAVLAAVDRECSAQTRTAGLLLCGPAGAGKTRLLKAFGQRRQMSGGAVVEGDLGTLVRAVVTRLGYDHPLIGHHWNVVERWTGEATHLPMLPPRDGTLRDRDGILQLLGAAYSPRATWAVDDVDRVDGPTAAVIDALVGGGTHSDHMPRVLLTTRWPPTGPHAAAIERWATEGRLKRVDLAELTASGIRALVQDVLDDSPDSDRIALSVHRASQGNPRFALEVLLAMMDAGVVAQAGDGIWRLVGEMDESPIPDALKDVCRQRIDALTPECRELLGALAAADVPLPRSVAARLGAEGSLVMLTERALVRSGGAEPQSDLVTIVHEAVAVAAREEMPEETQQQHICRVAEELEAVRFADVEVLARLWMRASKPAKAWPFALESARRAREKFDVEAALHWLAIVDQLGSDPELQGARGVDVQTRAQTLRQMLQMLRFRGRHDEQSVCLDRLSLLAQVASDAVLGLEVAGHKAMFWFDRGRHDLARQLCQTHGASARELQEFRPLARFLWIEAMVDCRTGGLQRALDLSEESLRLLGEDVDPEALELRVQNHINRGNAFGQQGQLEAARGAFEDALSICNQHAMVSSQIVCTMNLGICLAMQSRYGRALAHFERSRVQCERLGWRELGASLVVNQAEVERNIGNFEMAAERLKVMVDELHPERADPVAISALCTRAASLCALGQQRQGRAIVASALERIGDGASHPLMPRVYLTHAQLSLSEGTRDGRRRAIRALDRLVASSAPSHDRALAASRRARLALDEGDVASAVELYEHMSIRLDAPVEHGEVREGLVERLNVAAQIQAAQGHNEQARRLTELAFEELSEQAADLEEDGRATFLALPSHAQICREARRILGRTLGADAIGVDWEAELLREGMEAMQRLFATTGLTDVVNSALDELLRIGGFERVSVLTRQGERFVAFGARQAGRVPADPGLFGPSREVIELAARRREPIITPEFVAGAPPGTLYEAVYPLIADERLVGLVYLVRKLGEEGLSRTRRLVVATVANQFALLLRHHLQVDEIERLRRRAEADLTRTRARLVAESARREQAERMVEVQRRTVQLKHRYEDIIHRSDVMRGVLAQVDRLVDRKMTVLVRGESGTGKELIARALHFNGPRTSGPFVAINCGAIPRDLIESELFGHVRGAFTGAHKDRRGHFELAHTGTLFLDEIGELSPDVQVRLLRVLETSEVTPVGSSRRIKVDARIVAATHRDLLQEVRDGGFREDLYYRLNAVEIRLPSLRERPEDLSLLVDHFSQLTADDRGESPVQFPPGIMHRLAAHDWPGNVRELRNVVEYAALFADGGVVPDDLVLPF